MIEPVLAGTALAREIRTTVPDPGSVAVWRLGQSGVVLRFAGSTVLIDPYLSNHCEAVLDAPFDHRRLTRSPLDPVEIDMIDLIVCSHDHLDHLDPPTIRTLARQNPRARIAAPGPSAATLRGLGWESNRILLFDDGFDIRVGHLRVESFAVPHDDFDEGPDGHPYLGWIVSEGGVRVAHLGDARDHGRIRAALRGEPVDLLLVPINGRSPHRSAMGFAGNMSPLEAVRLAQDCHVRVTVPMHYDMFAQNVDEGALDDFAAAAAASGIESIALPVGGLHIVSSGR
ncbi:MBL fold metallo-hydrolase [Microbacterium phyllosphaerae]|uniref:MBL fold metallo-hydrolase n=1 Tax=Microbacterium phyllosphaerae TaxID=124798 RepID=UPI003D64CD2B